MFIFHFVPFLFISSGFWGNIPGNVFYSFVKFKAFLKIIFLLWFVVSNYRCLCQNQRFQIIKLIQVSLYNFLQSSQITSAHHSNPVKKWECVTKFCTLWTLRDSEMLSDSQIYTVGKCQTHSWIPASDHKFRTLFSVFWNKNKNEKNQEILYSRILTDLTLLSIVIYQKYGLEFRILHKCIVKASRGKWNRLQ